VISVKIQSSCKDTVCCCSCIKPRELLHDDDLALFNIVMEVVTGTYMYVSS